MTRKEPSPHPAPYKTSITVTARMEKGLKAQIDAAAKESGRSVSGEIIHRLEDYDRMKTTNEAILTAIRRADALASLAEMDASTL